MAGKRKYTIDSAIARLAEAGVKVSKDVLNKIESGKLGLSYLGAVDFLRTKGYVIVFLRK